MKRAVLVGALIASASCARILGFEEDRLANEDGTGGQPNETGGRIGEPSDAGKTASGGATAAAGRGEEAGEGSGGRGARGGAPSDGGALAGGRGGTGSGGAPDSGGTGAVTTTGGGDGILGGQGGHADGDNSSGAGGEGGSETCGGKAGPEMVRVGSYCIDSTEITYAQYDEFAKAGVSPATVVGCEWKPAFTEHWFDDDDKDMPVGNVDWCDAKAYCQWAGKRLCGRIGEGADPPNHDDYVNVASADEWYRVCSDGGTLKYSYGQIYDKTKCNSDSTFLRPVGSTPTCTAHDGKVFDLLGNTWEWVAACESTDQANPKLVRCLHRGGSYGFKDINCRDVGNQRRDFIALDLGIRCCSD